MRPFIIAMAMALGLVVLWAAILPLAAQPAPTGAAGASRPAVAKALFLCRGPHGVNQACVAALAQSLAMPEPTQSTEGAACHAQPQVLAALAQQN